MPFRFFNKPSEIFYKLFLKKSSLNPLNLIVDNRSIKFTLGGYISVCGEFENIQNGIILFMFINKCNSVACPYLNL